MAHVNLETGKIYGAKKGSLSYGHELGHLAFRKTAKGERIALKEELSNDLLNVIFFAGFWFYNIAPSVVKFVCAFFVFRWLYFYNYEEVWAWVYAFKLRNKKRLKCGAEKI